MNVEDVMPKWMTRHAITASGGERFIGSLSSGKPYSAPVPPRITARVGSDCNRWMGRTFEEPAKPLLLPLIEGSAHTLSRDHQKVIARWAIKTMLMNALAHPPAPDLSVYRAWRNNDGAPPPATRVHLGRFDSPGALPRSENAFVARESDRPLRLAWVPFKAIVGRLIIVASLQVNGPPVCTVAEAEGSLAEIWPLCRGPIHWPLAIGLDAEDSVKASIWRLR